MHFCSFRFTPRSVSEKGDLTICHRYTDLTHCGLFACIVVVPKRMGESAGGRVSPFFWAAGWDAYLIGGGLAWLATVDPIPYCHPCKYLSLSVHDDIIPKLSSASTLLQQEKGSYLPATHPAYPLQYATKSRYN